MHPFLSIITPTLQRESLIETCDSIDAQTFPEWEHIIMVDQEEFDHALLDRLTRPRRKIAKCPIPHRDGGNTCRHNAWPMALGHWVAYMDDDNYYADDQVFADLYGVLAQQPDEIQWALFPILRLGGRFYSDPPRSCYVDTLNFILRRDIARWPATNAYGSDGVLIDRLMADGVSYAAFPDFRPIAILPKISFCQ